MEANAEGQYKRLAESMSWSLDEYIRRKDFSDPFSLMKHRKRDRDIDPEALDTSLDAYIQSNPLLQKTRSHQLAGTASTSKGCGRFERRSLQDGDSSDEDDINNNNRRSVDSDVEMKPLITIKEEANDEDLSDIMNFSTAESRQGIRVRPQQWRLLPENLHDRPPGEANL